MALSRASHQRRPSDRFEHLVLAAPLVLAAGFLCFLMFMLVVGSTNGLSASP